MNTNNKFDFTYYRLEKAPIGKNRHSQHMISGSQGEQKETN